MGVRRGWSHRMKVRRCSLRHSFAALVRVRVRVRVRAIARARVRVRV